MGRKKIVSETNQELVPIRRAIDPKIRENNMIALSEALAEKQLREGTASSQVICHYLKLGSQQNQLEMEKLRNENELLKKKVEALDAQIETEASYVDAINAMKKYSGHLNDIK